ncbi:Rgp1-domain-containing protein [Obba rivulosa]|uniref:Rgp1-domain-containing protein n=1 Tax=Obba rivulosa TaxID=1052685 RepID=A0A8E2DQW8_9APHY|nr:Rgp1-domain-containing protein [Obba rivulosa]
MSDTATSQDDAIRVVVTPSQASYFAGEPFSVTITFTNTRTPELLSSRSASHSATSTHKRGAHSISSVPLARPPTSPGTRTALPAIPTRNTGVGNVITRKGLIGRGRPPKGADDLPEAEGRRRQLPKSLSVSLSPIEVAAHLKDNPNGKPALRSSVTSESLHASPTSPHISSPLARSASLPIASTHPHARKQSLLDGQLQLQDLKPPVSLSPFAPTPNASTSSFSISLDPIAEGTNSPIPPTPALPSPIPEASAVTIRTQISVANGTSYPSTVAKTARAHAYPPARAPARGAAQLGHGPPPSSASQAQPPRTAFSSSFPAPNTELILYSYAQLLGTVSVVPLPGTTTAPEQARTLRHLRTSLLKRQVVGGGSMNITSSQSVGHGPPAPPGPARRPSHGRSASLSSGLLSLLSPASAPQPWAPGHRARTSSVFSLFSTSSSTGASGVGLGLGVGIDEDEIDPETPLPTFEVQPAMLAVDLSLAPGESRSYTYSIALPENLPPTHKGRVLRFSYQFVLGICRAATASGSASAAGANSSSRVMKVPIRIYNYISVGKPPSPYDLLWPLSSWKTKSTQPAATVAENALRKKDQSIPGSVSGTYEELRTYARGLLASFPDGSSSGIMPKHPIEAVRSTPERIDVEREREREEAGGLTGCRQAVELLTRNPKKASYDVTKDGVKVAVLTFTKSAYRLGETVLGVVELNERGSPARVLKLSAMLEAHESLPASIASNSSSRHTRRVHAEHHSSFMPSTLRTTFSLDIPSDASPNFQVDVTDASANPGKRTPPGGLGWKVRLCLLVSVASPSAREGPDGVRLRHLVRDGPKGEWGTAWRAARTIAPQERPDPRKLAGLADDVPPTPSTAKSWMSFFATSILTPSNIDYHDGDEELEEEPEEEDDETGIEEEWRDVKAEMVECEVPITVWPGNTAFKATEVVFEV